MIHVGSELLCGKNTNTRGGRKDNAGITPPEMLLLYTLYNNP